MKEKYREYQEMLKSQPLEKYKNLCKIFFKDKDGVPFLLTNTQAEIFQYIYEPQYDRVAVLTPTQYGKTDTVSQAIVQIVVDRVEKVAIVAPKAEQASIIMNSVIKHIFDNDYYKNELEIQEGQTLERLKNERSRKRITFRNGSEIYILTADTRTISKEGQGMMGFGATIIVVDEASLIPDKVFNKIFRMLGGQKGAKLVKLGNAFFRNHFWRALKSDRYVKVWINWEIAVAEGRFTKEFIDEAREGPDALDEEDFNIFYNCVFPERRGENSLIEASWYEEACKRVTKKLSGFRQVGIDVARGGKDKSTYYLREDNQLIKRRVLPKCKDDMELVGFIQEELEKDKPDMIVIDIVKDAGVHDRLKELGYTNIYGMNGGASAPSSEDLDDDYGDDEMTAPKEEFLNMRAWTYWNLRKLLSSGTIGIYEYDTDEFNELMEQNYFFVSDRKKKIESKEEIKKRLGRSPDKADALSYCFAPVSLNNFDFDIV
jgi:hypothetical protein